MAATFAFLFFSMILVNNYVLVQFLGVCPFLGVSKNMRTTLRISLSVTLVMVLTVALVWPIYTFILVPLNLAYLKIVLFVLLITLLVQLLGFLLRGISPAMHRKLEGYLPLITTNCAVLGVALLVFTTPSLLNPSAPYLGYGESLVYALGAGAGFGLALVLFSGVRRRLQQARPPAAFAGMPLTLVSAGIVSLAFMGFGGVLENLFGIA